MLDLEVRRLRRRDSRALQNFPPAPQGAELFS